MHAQAPSSPLTGILASRSRPSSRGPSVLAGSKGLSPDPTEARVYLQLTGQKKGTFLRGKVIRKRREKVV
jgi:hypothetical protein